MYPHRAIPIAALALALIACQRSLVPENHAYIPLTTPALKRLHEMRVRGAMKAEWEANAHEPRVLRDESELRAFLRPWEPSTVELDRWERLYRKSSEVVQYGTDLDGRLVVFYDSDHRSKATWASWD